VFQSGCRIAVAVPQGLKPLIFPSLFGTTEVVPFQSADLFRDSLGYPDSSGDEEAAVAHDLFRTSVGAVLRFEPDVEAETDNVDVSSGAPGSAGVLAIRIAEGDVDAGELLVLKDVADDALDAEVGADGELADAVGVFIGMGVGPE